MASVELISVGIDIGTMTTQIVISKLLVAEMATLSVMSQARYGPASKPRADVAKKGVLYQSAVHLTPIDHDGLVDVDELEKILWADYKEAGFTPDQIDTGAVIITGESARSQNAERVLSIVAPLAGDFVSTPSRAPASSLTLQGKGQALPHGRPSMLPGVRTSTIGGGTTNVAVVHQGDLMETAPLSRPITDMTIFFSGGVADFYYGTKPIRTIQDVAVYGDIGPLMGEELWNHPRVKEWAVLRPLHTERATVMGASHETITLSGMTIWVAPKELPMRNVPVVRPIFDGIPDEQTLTRTILDGYSRWDLGPAKDRVALAVDLSAVGCYDDLKKLGRGIEAFASKHISPSIPLILVTSSQCDKEETWHSVPRYVCL